MFKDWGYEKLGTKEPEESIDEMKHADMIIERILFLDGIPNVQEMHKIMIGEEPVECLKCDFQIEVKAIPDLKTAIQHCEKVSDYHSTYFPKSHKRNHGKQASLSINIQKDDVI